MTEDIRLQKLEAMSHVNEYDLHKQAKYLGQLTGNPMKAYSAKGKRKTP